MIRISTSKRLLESTLIVECQWSGTSSVTPLAFYGYSASKAYLGGDEIHLQIKADMVKATMSSRKPTYYNFAVAAQEDYNIAYHEYMANHIDYYREQLKQMYPEQEGKFYGWAIGSSLSHTNAFWELPKDTQRKYKRL